MCATQHNPAAEALLLYNNRIALPTKGSAKQPLLNRLQLPKRLDTDITQYILPHMPASVDMATQHP
jgi:hypothetical protein